MAAARKEESRRKKYEVLNGQLESEVASFKPAWRDLGDYALPSRPRFQSADVNKGDRRNLKIVDSTATMAARTLRSGMMSGVTSPARPWFRLTSPDPAIAENQEAKDWLSDVTREMTHVFLKSNLYKVLPVIYGDIGVFGTAALFIEEDFDDVIRCYSFPVGSFKISNNAKLKVDTFSRDFKMTVRQIVESFGNRDEKGNIDWKNISEHVKSQYESGHVETWVEVCHLIKPNENFREGYGASKFKKYISVYYEKGNCGTGSYPQSEDGRFLREKGYDFFPVLCPRWEVTGEDVYGTDCPGMVAIGDIKQLQLGVKRVAQAVEKLINPPMIAPTSMKQQKTTILPGDITYVDVRDGFQGFRPAHEIQPRVGEMENINEQTRTRIRKAFFENLFLMLENDMRSNVTAREIQERHEEKLLALGPVLEQLNQDLLDPLIDITFEFMVRQKRVPVAPEIIAGQRLKVEYISVMAQAQKLVGIGGIERGANFVGNLAAVAPDVVDKIDWDQMVDEYGDAVGLSSKIVRSDDQVADIRGQRAKAAQRAQAAESVAQGAQAAKALSETSLEGDSALSRIMAQAKAGALTEGVV